MRWPWRPGVDSRDIDRELADHLELEAEAQRLAGRDAAGAARAARLAFGNPAAHREDVRAVWTWTALERLRLDIDVAVRVWARTPGLSLVALLTIALGIAATTALAAQMRAVFWTELPLPRADELQLVSWSAARRPYVVGPNVFGGPVVDGVATLGSFSYPAYRAMATRATTPAGVACWSDLGEARPVLLSGRGVVRVQFVSGTYFETLGVQPALGRTLQPDDEPLSGWPPVVVLSHGFWQRAYGGAADVTSRTVRLNGRDFAVVGVAAAGFFGLDPASPPDLYLPIRASEIAAATPNGHENRGFWNLCRVVVRLEAARSATQVRAELDDVLAAVVAEARPAGPYDPPRTWFTSARRGVPTLRDGTATPLATLLAVIGVLLLAVAANLAGLLLARGQARRREVATRLALGASTGRILRQLVTESLVLSVAGGMLGVLLAAAFGSAAASLLAQFLPQQFGADREVAVAASIDVTVLLVALLVTLATSLLFGLAPGIYTARQDLVSALTHHGATTAGQRPWGSRLSVACQAALAVVLVAGAAGFVQTVERLRAADLGFVTEGLVYARIEPRAGGFGQAQRIRFVEDAVGRLSALPGALSASAAGAPPLGPSNDVGLNSGRTPVCPDGGQLAGQTVLTAADAVAPNYFHTLGLSLIAGRDFRYSDTGASRVVVVNAAFMRAHLPGATGDGHAVTLGRCDQPNGRWAIIGVVADSRTDLRSPAEPMVYHPIAVFPAPITLILRSSLAADAMIPAVRAALAALNADVPAFGEAPVGALIERRLRRERVLSGLLSAFAVATLGIAALGVYGLLSYAVVRRRAEISIRMAIGATPGRVLGLVLRDGLIPIAAGVVAGAAVAVAAADLVAPQLYGVSASDPWLLAAAGAGVLAIALIGALAPAWAALRVPPVLALRE
jgi:predicted permease